MSGLVRGGIEQSHHRPLPQSRVHASSTIIQPDDGHSSNTCSLPLDPDERTAADSSNAPPLTVTIGFGDCGPCQRIGTIHNGCEKPANLCHRGAPRFVVPCRATLVQPCGTSNRRGPSPIVQGLGQVFARCLPEAATVHTFARMGQAIRPISTLGSIWRNRVQNRDYAPYQVQKRPRPPRSTRSQRKRTRYRPH